MQALLSTVSTLGRSVLTHVISNETDAGAAVVVPRRMGAVDVPSSALVHVAGAAHTETAKQGHSCSGMLWA